MNLPTLPPDSECPVATRQHFICLAALILILASLALSHCSHR